MYLNMANGWILLNGICLTITWDVFECPDVIIGIIQNGFNYNMGCIWIQDDGSEPVGGTGFNYNMGCIWIVLSTHAHHLPNPFNYNMGCIWIAPILHFGNAFIRLTITWDVFELALTGLPPSENPFNYNMGCIWIPKHKTASLRGTPFNYNMGCIWMINWILVHPSCVGLTITWDVFEYRMGENIKDGGSSLTITWDVFELGCPYLRRIILWV